MAMKRIIYAMLFKGGAAPGAAANKLKVNAAGPSCVLTSVIGPKGVDGTVETAPAGNAQFESEVTMTSEGRFQESGSITFGEGGHRLRFKSIDDGHFGVAPDPAWKQGCVNWRVEGGDGQFAGAAGIITSNFLFNDAGEVADYQFGVIYVRDMPDKTVLHPDPSKSTFEKPPGS